MRTLTRTPTSLANVTPERDAAIQKALFSFLRAMPNHTNRAAGDRGGRAGPPGSRLRIVLAAIQGEADEAARDIFTRLGIRSQVELAKVL
jgi:hypothetical protein